MTSRLPLGLAPFGPLVLRPTPEELIATLSPDELVAFDLLLEKRDDEAALERLVPDPRRRLMLRGVACQVEQLGGSILPRDQIDPATIDHMEVGRQLAIAAKARRDESDRQRDLRLSFVYRRTWELRARPAALGVFHRSRPYSLVSACHSLALDVASAKRPEDVSAEVRCRHPACREAPR